MKLRVLSLVVVSWLGGLVACGGSNEVPAPGPETVEQAIRRDVQEGARMSNERAEVEQEDCDSYCKCGRECERRCSQSPPPCLSACQGYCPDLPAEAFAKE
ncbi:hypothetical protein WA016_06672 [Myxococcus stipitatus]